MLLCLVSTRRRHFSNFEAALCVHKHGSSDAKSCPEPLGGREGGGESSCPGLNGAGRSLEESPRSRWSVPEQRNATCLKCDPVRCTDVAWSTPAPHRRPRREPKQQRFFSEDQVNPSQLSSFFAPRFLRHGLFFFHSLTSCSIKPPPPLPSFPLSGCRVSLSSCHTGPPTLTHGGREGETN